MLVLLSLCSFKNPAVFWLSLSDAFSQIIANEGVGTLWNGTLPSLILVVNPAVQFMFYEAMKRRAGRGGKKVRRHQKDSTVLNTTFQFKLKLRGTEMEVVI